MWREVMMRQVMFWYVMLWWRCDHQKPPAERRRPRDARGTPEGRQRDARAYIRPLCSAPSPTPAAQKPPAERRRPRDARGTLEGRQGVHPTPLQCTKSRACHAKATGSAAETRDARGTPEGRQGVHPTPLQCTKSRVWSQRESGTREGRQRDARGTPEGRHRDARAWTRPLCSAPRPAPATHSVSDVCVWVMVSEWMIVCGMCVCE